MSANFGLTSRQQDCLSGEHEIGFVVFVGTINSNLSPGTPVISAANSKKETAPVFACKHCGCLYVEKS